MSLRNVAAYRKNRVLISMPETLLYADDNALHREVMEARLLRLGYRVVTASSGLDALSKFAAEPIDLAIVDYYMPVIIFSGTFTLSEMVIAFVDGFISTSDEPEVLLNKIADVLAPQRSIRAS